jgi:hypothetical protein
VYHFDPNSTYEPGNQKWIGGVNNDDFYESTNSSTLYVDVYGIINVSFLPDSVNTITQVSPPVRTFNMGLYDEFDNLVEESGFACTFYRNGTQVFTGNTNDTGLCSYTWASPNCSELGNHTMNVILSQGLGSSYYHITNSLDSTVTTLKSVLDLSILSPLNGTIYYEQSPIEFNSTLTTETCGIPNKTYTVGWYFQSLGLCPPSNPVTTGDNTSTSIPVSCDPREQIIIANASGDYYVSSKKYANIYIYGWADVNITDPELGNITDRVGGLQYVDLVCNVKDNLTGIPIVNYDVDFYDGDTFIGTNTTFNSSGYSTYEWNITSNVDVPDGNHTIRCVISDEPGKYYNASVNESETWIILRETDYSPPYFGRVHANSTTPNNDVIIEAQVNDWFGIDKVWANVTYPNSTTYLYYLSNLTDNPLGGIWRTTLTNVSSVGPYDYSLYANDTSGLLNSTSGWFDVYTKLYFIGNATNNDNNNMTLNFTFYRPGTNKTLELPDMHIDGGSYNFSVFNTNVDLDLEVDDHEMFFSNVNLTSSVISQFDENATNITNPLTFDNVSVAEILLQATTKNKMTALGIDSNLEFDNLTITLNFTRNLNDYSDLSKPALRIYQCPNWQLENRSGCSGSWTMLDTTLNSSSNLVSADVSSLSCFVVAEYCPSCASGDGENGNDPGLTGGSGSSSSRAQCGNGICEASENVENCPEDCGKAQKPPFNLKTNLTDVEIETGRLKIYNLWIENTYGGEINTSIQFGGSTSHFLSVDENYVSLNVDEEKNIPIYANVPLNTEPAVYTGEIVVTAQGYTQRLPVTITVPLAGSLYLDIDVKSLTTRVNPNATAIFRIQIQNIGYRNRFNITINHTARNLETKEIIFQEIETREIETSLLLMKNVHIPRNATLGEYTYEVDVQFDGEKISSADTFVITQSFFTSRRIRVIILITFLILSVPAVYFMRKLYKRWRASKVRYIFPVDPKSLPKGELWLGQVAETNQKATFEMKELKTHVLTAGATGSGKTVSSMVIVEELLEKKIPVVVFDPTAQWTGFVRPCKDSDLLKFYKKFGMNLRDVKPYKGMIYDVKDPNVKIDFKKYMNPGEITVFTLNKLKPGEYDEAVRSIVDTIFEQGWEESTDVQLVIVLDEVHRLLEKYGGKGGYVSLEKACREFRKWGIGLIMVSQVLSDFKEAIKGNVLTEVQLHTKSLGDLERIERKFGEDYAKRVTKLEVGIGMVQNPKYNKGKPYFVSFRPTYHSPHKIPDKELELYKKYEQLIKGIEDNIENMKESGEDVFGLNVELNLAKDKLKKGRFRMAKIYIDSLTKSLSKGKE